MIRPLLCRDEEGESRGMKEIIFFLPDEIGSIMHHDISLRCTDSIIADKVEIVSLSPHCSALFILQQEQESKE
jgi:hypothetical protein